MPYFPFFVDIKDKRGLIIGTGEAARQKIKKLRPYGPNLQIIEQFREELLVPVPAFVILALDDKEENHRIAELCKEKGIPVNVVDDPAYCSFYFPALVERGSMSIGISTAGKSPAAAVYVKTQVEGILPDQTEEILDWMQELRPVVRECIPDNDRRKVLLRNLLAEAMEKGRILSREEMKELWEPEIYS